MAAPDGLQGLRVLVAEDEILVAMIIEEMCDQLGCNVVGPFATVMEALEASRGGDFDVALVDMNLVGLKADPVLAELRTRAIPFAIASGAAPAEMDIDAAFVLSKPFSFDQFSQCLAALAGRARREGPQSGG